MKNVITITRQEIIDRGWHASVKDMEEDKFDTFQELYVENCNKGMTWWAAIYKTAEELGLRQVSET